MIDTHIDLPGAPPELRQQVEAADVMLHEEADKIKGVTLSGEWGMHDQSKLPGYVHLTLKLGTVGAGFGVVPAELREPERIRFLVRNTLWALTTNYAQSLHQEILQLREELKRDFEPVGA